MVKSCGLLITELKAVILLKPYNSILEIEGCCRKKGKRGTEDVYTYVPNSAPYLWYIWCQDPIIK